MRRFIFREVAEEIDLEANGLGEVAFATLLEGMVAAQQRQNLEVLAARLGLGRDAMNHVVESAQCRADLMADAHKLITALIPLERALGGGASNSGVA